MAKIVLPLEVARSFAAGEREHAIDGAGDIRAVVRVLDERYPGIGERLNQGLAAAIDGEIFQDWMLQQVGDNSEVVFIPAIEGG